MKHKNYPEQSGAVSIFVVIFAALFITIITVSFVGVMLKNQTQSVNADLADSAYDSALSGIEDAKRAIELCTTSATPPAECAELTNPTASSCNLIKQILYGAEPDDNDETLIQSTDGSAIDQSLDQAYTCVKIKPFITPLKLTSVPKDIPTVIPIETVGPYNQITIQWRRSNTTNNPTCFNNTASFPLPVSGGWTSGAPGCPTSGSIAPVLRVQFVKLDGAGFSIDDFGTPTNPRSRTASAFLYPKRAAAFNIPTNLLSGSVSYTAPVGAYCTTMCTKILDGATVGNERASYLVITPVYRDAEVWISASSSGTAVPFTNVYEIDVTGRANDLFRRIKAQITRGTGASDPNDKFPAAALEVNKLCKNFSVTNNPADYSYSPASCAP